MDLIMRLRPLILGALTLLAFAGIANDAVWEVLFSGKTKDVEAKVELKTSSVRERLVRGEKIVTAHMRHFYREGRQQTKATGDYEIHSAARVTYRSNLTMDITAADRSKTSVSTSNREMLAGKAHNDMVGVMDILCNR